MSKKMLGVVVTFAVMVAACGSSGGSKVVKPQSSSSSNSTTSSSPGGGSTDPTSTTLRLVDTSKGKVVGDSAGKVLYIYTPDGSSTESKVAAGLLGAWPPVQADAPPTLGPGLTAKASIGTQPNDQKWVLYNGHLLYGFTGDAKAGDINGNGVAGVWFALNAAGEPLPA